MNYQQLLNKIFSLQTDEEIYEFIKERLNDLENRSVEKTVGQNYEEKFKDYISSKVHFKPADKLYGVEECPDLIYDDIEPYYKLVKEILKNKSSNMLFNFNLIYYIICEYLPSNHDVFRRMNVYDSPHPNGRISIREIKEKQVAFCSENAGLTHNLLKFLGIDSEFTCGRKVVNNEIENHAYNFIYPNGYTKEPTLLYDPSNFLNFRNSDKTISVVFIKTLTEEEKDKLLNGEMVTLDLSGTEKMYRRIYGSVLENYSFEETRPIYGEGLDSDFSRK